MVTEYVPLLKHLLHCIHLVNQQIFIHYLLHTTHYSSSQDIAGYIHSPWCEAYILEKDKGISK